MNWTFAPPQNSYAEIPALNMIILSNILKKKNHMIISVDAEKVLEKKSKIHF